MMQSAHVKTYIELIYNDSHGAENFRFTRRCNITLIIQQDSIEQWTDKIICNLHINMQKLTAMVDLFKLSQSNAGTVAGSI